MSIGSHHQQTPRRENCRLPFGLRPKRRQFLSINSTSLTIYNSITSCLVCVHEENKSKVQCKQAANVEKNLLPDIEINFSSPKVKVLKRHFHLWLIDSLNFLIASYTLKRRVANDGGHFGRHSVCRPEINALYAFRIYYKLVARSE